MEDPDKPKERDTICFQQNHETLGRFTLFDPKKLGLLAFRQAYQNNWLKADSFILQEGLKFPKNLYPIIELSRICSYQECK